MHAPAGINTYQVCPWISRAVRGIQHSRGRTLCSLISTSPHTLKLPVSHLHARLSRRVSRLTPQACGIRHSVPASRLIEATSQPKRATRMPQAFDPKSLPAINLPHLPLAHYEFLFEPTTRIHMPDYSGSAWRGAFGHALKRIVCVTKEPRCPDCLLQRACAYPYIFETPTPSSANKMRRYNEVPHPFVLDCDEPQSQRGGADTLQRLALVLVGRSNQYLPYIIQAFVEAARSGVGRGRQPMRVVAVNQDPQLDGHWQTIYSPGQPLNMHNPCHPSTPDLMTDSVTLRFHTPLRLKSDNHTISGTRLAFHHLFGSLLRRVSLLSYFHTDTALETDFAGLMAQARQFTIHSQQLRWYDWTRYSARQATTMQMGGLIGSIALDATDLAPFWPYLWLGQWIHAGKGTSMGLGKYTIEAAASLPPRTQRSPIGHTAAIHGDPATLHTHGHP